MEAQRKGMLLVISGPSGAGKGTLLERLLKDDPRFGFSVSATTRSPRPGEIDGVHYHFLTEEAFLELVAQDAFLEHAQVHGNRYGTLVSEVRARLDRGMSCVLDIDVQGALHVMERMPECVSVFVMPPSLEELRRRLEGRGTETREQIERRMANAVGEMALAPRYEYVVINDDLDEAYAVLKAIICAEEHRSVKERS